MNNVNVIGAGLAGLSAALALSKKGVKCNLISLQPSERAQSVMAEGGINAALDTMGEGDVCENHFQDTVKGGVFLADPDAVRDLVNAAPGIVDMLYKLGVPFQMENGKIIQRNFGGQKLKRTAFVKSSTGKVLMTALIDEVRKEEAKGNVVRFSHHEALCPVISEDECTGVVVKDTFTGEILTLQGPVIAATGGMNGLFEGMTTGSTANGGDFTAACFDMGVEMGNPEMIQFHPTTARIPGKRLLISEAARGEGGRLFVNRGGRRYYFMEELFPEAGNLAPRDVISRQMVKVPAESNDEPQVYLEMSHLPEKTWKEKLPDMRDEIKSFLGIDPAKMPVPVSPGIHFFMGGLLTDRYHRTNVNGLYAAGECACQYHGANRLGGNSMLGAIYGGMVAADSFFSDTSNGHLNRDLRTAAADSLFKEHTGTVDTGDVSAKFSKTLCDILSAGLGIIRDEKKMESALKEIEELKADSLTPKEHRRTLLGEAMLLCALQRKESRGAHTRSDYPERDDELFQKTSVAVRRGDITEVSLRDLGIL